MKASMGSEARQLDERPLALIERFHGHLGPYVVLGYLAGRLALERLDPDPFNLKAAVAAGTSPPTSCFVDGVQLGSGCTLGKRNIEMLPEERVEATFSSKDGRTLVVRVRPEVLVRVRSGQEDMEAISRGIVATPREQVFDLSVG